MCLCIPVISLSFAHTGAYGLQLGRCYPRISRLMVLFLFAVIYSTNAATTALACFFRVTFSVISFSSSPMKLITLITLPNWIYRSMIFLIRRIPPCFSRTKYNKVNPCWLWSISLRTGSSLSTRFSSSISLNGMFSCSKPRLFWLG